MALDEGRPAVKPSPGKVAGASALMALALLLFILIFAALQKFKGLPPLDTTGLPVLSTLTPGQTPYWVFLQTIYDIFL